MRSRVRARGGTDREELRHDQSSSTLGTPIRLQPDPFGNLLEDNATGSEGQDEETRREQDLGLSLQWKVVGKEEHDADDDETDDQGIRECSPFDQDLWKLSCRLQRFFHDRPRPTLPRAVLPTPLPIGQGDGDLPGTTGSVAINQVTRR